MGVGQALREAVASLPGVLAETLQVDDGEVASARCMVAPGGDPATELGDRLQRAGAAVHELAVDLPTLEEYFYAITDGRDELRDDIEEAAT